MSVTEAYVDKAIEASEARTDMKFERVLTEIRHLAGEVQAVKDRMRGVEGEMHGMREDNLRTRRAVWAAVSTGVAAIAGLIVAVVALVLTAFQAGLGV